MVHSLDENVGRVLARLDERGLADRTRGRVHLGQRRLRQRVQQDSA